MTEPQDEPETLVMVTHADGTFTYEVVPGEVVLNGAGEFWGYVPHVGFVTIPKGGADDG